MNLIEALEELKKGKKVRRKSWIVGQYIFLAKDKTILNHEGYEFELYCSKPFINSWELYEKNSILDEEEKAYLEAVLKPFKNRIKFLMKGKVICDRGEFIIIKLDTESITLPFFKSNTMYKGMKLNKGYTKEELGLFEND